jgi:hypothetical protein
LEDDLSEDEDVDDLNLDLEEVDPESLKQNVSKSKKIAQKVLSK